MASFKTGIFLALDRQEVYLSISRNSFRLAVDAGTNLHTFQNGQEAVKLFPETLKTLKAGELHVVEHAFDEHGSDRLT